MGREIKSGGHLMKGSLTWLGLGEDHAGDESWDLGDLFLYIIH